MDQVSEKPRSPEEEYEALKSQFEHLVVKDEPTLEDIRAGWHLYEQLYLVEKQIKTGKKQHDAEIANLMNAVEQEGAFGEISAASDGLNEFRAKTEIIIDRENPGKLVNNLRVRGQQEPAQKFIGKMVLLAQARIGKLQQVSH